VDSDLPKDQWPVCTGCDKRVRWLNTYFDRNGYYSGKACSNRCSYRLPGQGRTRGYEADHREDDNADDSLEVKRVSSNIEMRTLGFEPYWRD